MTARELFESALDAARQIARLEERLQIMRERIGVQGHGYEAHGKSGTLDPMRKVDDLVDWQAECETGLAECRKSLDEAYEVVAGIEAGGGHEMAEVLTRRYLMAEDVAHIAVQDNLAETDGMGDVWLECDACNWQMPLEPSTPRFNYCPNCGRKVVDE